MPPVTWTTSVTMARSVSTCRIGLQAVLAPHGNQKKEKQREHEPQHHAGEKGHDGQRAGSETDDGQLDREQHHQDQDANLDQPGQPVPLIGDGVHEFAVVFAKRLLRAPSRELRATPFKLASCYSFELVPARSPELVARSCFFYPASFPIIANNGMYREIMMPPMLTPRQPMMTGSSMASMSLVAASTSSS